MVAINFLLAGVGGQGTILASDVLASVGLRAGYDVKKSEVHGMAQRGGSVTTSIRWGDKVYSPLIGPGEADFFVSFEKLEALRHIGKLRPGGVVLVNDYAIPPLSVSSGSDQYPDDERLGGLEDVELPTWLEAVRDRVPPRFADLNEQAFLVGREAMEKVHPCPLP